MKTSDWIDAKTACAELGVKPQTLYAYVSRHKIRVVGDPADARSSLYSKHDIEGLLNQQRRPRARSDVAKGAIRWGEPVLETSIAEVRDGTFWIRGRSIDTCAEELTLEEAAALLIGVDDIQCPAMHVSCAGEKPFSRAMRALALEAESAPALQAMDQEAVAKAAGRMLSVVTNACLGQPRDGPVHQRVAATWGVATDQQDALRQAIVLLCEHELNPSAFAVRICASTNTNLPSALLAGMATLSGTKHGGASDLTLQAILSMQQGHFGSFRKSHARVGSYGFGFGHPLYPQGDPRAACLLRLIPHEAPVVRAIRQIASQVGHPPNVDAGLVAFTQHFGCPTGAAKVIFAIGRTAGWIAHAIEQSRSGSLIRPRARYRPPPE